MFVCCVLMYAVCPDCDRLCVVISVEGPKGETSLLSFLSLPEGRLVKASSESFAFFSSFLLLLTCPNLIDRLPARNCLLHNAFTHTKQRYLRQGD